MSLKERIMVGMALILLGVGSIIGFILLSNVAPICLNFLCSFGDVICAAATIIFFILDIFLLGLGIGCILYGMIGGVED